MMKALQYLVAIVFVVAGILLLVGPSHAAVVTATAFVPTRFTVVDEGTVGKPDVVMIPGLSSSRAVWEGEAKLLVPNYRLHLVQVDGFAGAAAGANATGPMLPGIVEELHAYIEAGKMKPVVVGHSLGGLLTLMLAEKYPEDVRKMVIVDALPYYGVVFNPDATVEVVKPQAEAMAGQIAGMPADQFAMMAPMMAAQMVKDADGQKLVAAASLATDRSVMVKAMVEDLSTDLRGDVGSIKTPTLVLFAVDAGTPVPDPVKYEAEVRDGYRAMPNVTLVKVEGSG